MGNLQHPLLGFGQFEAKLLLDVRLSCVAGLPVGDNRVGHDADILPLGVLLAPIDLAEIKHALAPVRQLHQLRPHGTDRTEYDGVR